MSLFFFPCLTSVIRRIFKIFKWQPQKLRSFFIINELIFLIFSPNFIPLEVHLNLIKSNSVVYTDECVVVNDEFFD